MLCYLCSGSDDGIQLFNSVSKQQEVYLDTGSVASLPLIFVPLRMEARHCAVILSNQELGDVVLYIAVTVKYPRPIIPEAKCLHSGTLVSKETRTLYLKSLAGDVIEEDILIRSSNVSFESAALELAKLGMSSKELKRRVLTESLQYAALSTAVTALQIKPETTNVQSEKSEQLVFNVEASDSSHYTVPSEISIPADSTGMLVSRFSYVD